MRTGESEMVLKSQGFIFYLVVRDLNVRMAGIPMPDGSINLVQRDVETGEWSPKRPKRACCVDSTKSR